MANSNKSGSWKLPLILGLILGGLVLTFAFQNSEEVVVKFLLWEGSAALSLTYFLLVACTLFIAFLFNLPSKFKTRRLEKEIKALKENQDAVSAPSIETDFIDEPNT